MRGRPLKVCLLTDHHISVNPRVWKEAFFYEKRGFEVVIISMWHNEDLRAKDLKLLEGRKIVYKSYLNLIPAEVNTFKRFLFRLRKRLASEAQKLLNLSSGLAISHAPDLMFKMAVDENADLYCAHLECAFFAGRKLIQHGKTVAFDFEDWYSRDYLMPTRPVSLLISLERFALENGLFCTTTSQSLSNALQLVYKPTKPIHILYNGFPGSYLRSRNVGLNKSMTKGKLRLLWFSRTVGPNRGIEKVIKAVVHFEMPVEVHLLGKMEDGYESYLNKLFPADTKHNLQFHPFIPHHELDDFIAQFDIGLAVEQNINDNRSLTITNKLLQYLHTGIPVIASITEGQAEVASYFPDTMRVIDTSDNGHWNEAIKSLTKITDSERKKQIDIYKVNFSWEAQEIKLQTLVEHIL